MVKSQTIRSINKLVASMSSLMHGFAVIAGSIREKTIKDITRPSPLNGHVMKYVFELRRTFPNYWCKNVLPEYCHFKILNAFEYNIWRSQESYQ